MTLTTHSIIAVAITKPLARMHPLVIFLVAIASHYASDSIPHWDYSVSSMDDTHDLEKRHWGTNRKALRRDLAHFAIDGFLGAAIVLLAVRPVTSQQWTWTILAIIGGSLPDFLQGVAALGISWMKPIQRFHDRWHTHIRLGPYPLLGIPFQALIAGAALYTLLI